MFPSSLLIVLASCLSTVVQARLHSLPEDTYAFPKYRVTFLNEQPILNHTAERWLTHGLRGGEQEFLDQPWKEDPSHTPLQRKEIGSSDTPVDTLATDSRSFASANYTIEHMKMGPKDSYLCYIPKPSESASSSLHEEAETDTNPARSWSLLQPLSGTCLYHRQGWFTYSYCHNKDIRQFKELTQPLSRLSAGTYKPEEDPEWESYTLGCAPRSAEETGADLTVAEKNAQAANLELARNAGSRYLVQRWGDGTICDMTGKPREVEVQFHCSMVMTDHILFVKEAKTCSYVLVIHTPRLCGEPGFKSRRDSGEEALIRCREVVDTLPERTTRTPSGLISDQPFKYARRKTVLPPPTPAKEKLSSSSSDSNYDELLKKAIKELLTGKAGSTSDGIVVAAGDSSSMSAKALQEAIEDGEIIVEFVDDLDGEILDTGDNRFVEALRAAGYDVRSEVVRAKKVDKKSGDEKESGSSSGSSKKKSRDEKEDTSSSKGGKGRLQKILEEHLEL